MLRGGRFPSAEARSDRLKAAALDSGVYVTHSMRRTKAAQINRKTGNLRAVQLLLGPTKLESTVLYLGIEVDDALRAFLLDRMQGATGTADRHPPIVPAYADRSAQTAGMPNVRCWRKADIQPSCHWSLAASVRSRNAGVACCIPQTSRIWVAPMLLNFSHQNRRSAVPQLQKQYRSGECQRDRFRSNFGPTISTL